jgi:hypothetical protein
LRESCLDFTPERRSYVYPYPLSGTQNDLLALPAQVFAGIVGQFHDPSGGVQGTPEVVVCRASLQIGPQGFHELLAVEAVTRGEGEQLHQACGFPQPPLVLGDGPPSYGN